MPNDRHRTRHTEARRIRRPSTPSSPSDDASPHDKSPGESARLRLSRRWLLGTAVAAVVAAGTFFFSSGSRSLPIPAGQEAGIEYRAATLAVRSAPTVPLPPDHTSWSSCVASTPTKSLQDLDLVLALDTTGSMRGVLGDLKAHVAQLISSLRTGGGSVRVGLVAYRDLGDEFVTRSFPLTPLDSAGVAGLQSFIAGLHPAGGGDWPEAMDQALHAAASMAWRGNVPSSIVVIGDAPAHPEGQAQVLALAQAFASKIPGGAVSVIDSGSGADRFLQAIPKHGSGQYVTYDGHILHSLLPAITGCPSK